MKKISLILMLAALATLSQAGDSKTLKQRSAEAFDKSESIRVKAEFREKERSQKELKERIKKKHGNLLKEIGITDLPCTIEGIHFYVDENADLRAYGDCKICGNISTAIIHEILIVKSLSDLDGLFTRIEWHRKNPHQSTRDEGWMKIPKQ